MTAHDVVAVLRKRLGIKRIGHAGTLDPLATGVLPVAVGSATRLLPYLRSGKEYLAEVQFGVATDTADAEGTVVAEADCVVGEADLSEALDRFRGPIRQQPPMVSAVHHQGRRLYELAREGIVIADRPYREVTIDQLVLEGFWPGPRPRALLRVSCSAGTYIRSLAVDLGAALGVPASLAFLLRTRSGDFPLDRAQLLGDEPAWVSEDLYLSHLSRREADAAEAKGVSHGRSLPARGEPEGWVRVFQGDRLLAIYERRGDELMPLTVFSAASEMARS